MKYILAEDRHHRGYYFLKIEYQSATSKSTTTMESQEIKTIEKWLEFLGVKENEVTIKKV